MKARIVEERKVVLVRLNRRVLSWGLATGAFLSCAYGLLSETLTMTAYYPSPYGVYSQLMSTAQTYLARDGGGVAVGTRSPRAQSKLDVEGAGTILLNSGPVGVGTPDPDPNAALDVRGAADISGALNANGAVHANAGLVLPVLQATPCANGTVALNGSGGLQVCGNSAWQSVAPGSGAPAKGTVLEFPGSNAQCPSGTSPSDYRWIRALCSGSGPGSCWTPGGWGGGACWYANQTTTRWGSTLQTFSCATAVYDAYRCVVN